MGKISIVILIFIFTINIVPSNVIAEGIPKDNHSLLVIRDVQSTNTIITPKPVIKKAVTTSVKKETSNNYLQNIPKQESCFNYVDKYSSMYGVDSNLLTKIIRAESGGNSLAKNKNSTASGCGQFIQSTWSSTLRQMGREWVTPFNAEANVEAMAWKIANGGIGAWNASRSKWSQ